MKVRYFYIKCCLIPISWLSLSFTISVSLFIFVIFIFHSLYPCLLLPYNKPSHYYFFYHLTCCVGSDSTVVAECFIDIDRSTAFGGDTGSGIRGLSSSGPMFLEVEYSRELLPKGARNSSFYVVV